MTQPQRQREFSYTDDDFRFIAERAYAIAGITLADHKRDMVYSRIVRRVRALGLSSIGDYCDYLENDKAEQETGNFINAITTNLTKFYREPHHFEHLVGYLKEITPQEKRLRLWSAGCSTGMEPYTIALTCHAALADAAKRDLRILATDIDTGVLAKASEGRYAAEEIDGIPREQLLKFFTKKEEDYEAAATLKSLIAFKQLNLLGDWPMKGPFDVIFCRNVVIYFDKPTQSRLFNRYADTLKPGGMLYIGHSESVRDAALARFDSIGHTIYRRRR